MHRNRRRAGAWLALVGAALAAVVAGWLGAKSSRGDPGVRLGIFDRPATAADALPTAILGSPAAIRFAGATSARLAQTNGTRSVFVVRGRGATVCVVVADSADQGYATDCASRRLLATGAIYLSMPHPDGTLDVVGVADDRVTSVQQAGAVAPTRNNVFVLNGVRGQVISLARSDGVRTVDLGPQSPLPR